MLWVQINRYVGTLQKRRVLFSSCSLYYFLTIVSLFLRVLVIFVVFIVTAYHHRRRRICRFCRRFAMVVFVIVVLRLSLRW